MRAVRVPTKREPRRPGVWVTAMASIFDQSSTVGAETLDLIEADAGELESLGLIEADAGELETLDSIEVDVGELESLDSTEVGVDELELLTAGEVRVVSLVNPASLKA